MRFRMKNALWRGLGMALLILLPTTGCALQQSPQVEPAAPAVSATATGAAVPASEEPRLSGGRLVVRGRAIPAFNVELSFERSGVVKEVLVREGATLQAGDPIARLDDADAELAVEEAKATLKQSRAEYERLLAGATPEEIQRAQLQIARARAEFRVTEAQVTDKEIETAQQTYEAARLRLQELLDGPRAERIATAQAEIDRAVAELESIRARTSADKSMAESDLLIAANKVRNLQDTYQRIFWNNERRRSELNQEERDAEARALRNLKDAEEELKQRQINLEELRQVEITAIAVREANLRAARADYALLLARITDGDIAAARATLVEAEARLQRLTGARRDAELASARTDIALAEANLAILTADPSTEALAIAEARIYRAEVNLKQAELNVARLTLNAPLAATVSTLNIVPGQVIEARKPVAMLADFSQWRIITEDLSELSVVHIREGDTARIVFFALPGVEITGKVVQINTVGTAGGTTGVTYVGVIEPTSWDSRLRWNMSASIEITPSDIAGS